MVNRFGRSPGAISPFDPKGATIEALPGVQRGAGQEAEALFQVGSELAGVFGRMADQQAQIEGKRAGAVAGNETDFRPSGATTIRGRAFDEAATSTYLDKLDAKISLGMQEAYLTNRDNPVALKSALDAFKRDLIDNDVFPEIAGRVEASFERSRLPLQVRALTAMEERQRDEARGARFTRDLQQQGLQTVRANAAPRDPKVIAETRQWLADEAARDQVEVSNRRMSATEAAQRAAQRSLEIFTAQKAGIVGDLADVASVDSAIEALQKDKQAGRLGDMADDPRKLQAFETMLLKRREMLATAGGKVVRETSSAVDDILKRSAEGYRPTPAEMATVRASAASTPEGGAVLARLERRTAVIDLLDTRGPDAVDALIRERRAVAPAGLAKEDADELIWADKLSTERRASLAKDPIGVSARLGIAKADPLPIDDTANLAAAARGRAALAESLPAHLNPDRKVLLPEEVKAIERKLMMGGEPAMETLKALVAGFGPSAPRVMTELGGKVRQDARSDLAQAGLLLASGGSERTARELLNSVQLRSIAATEGTAKLPSIDASLFGKAFTEVTGSTLVDSPTDQGRVRHAAESVAAYRLRGEDPKGPKAALIYKDAINDVLGAQEVGGKLYGGAAQVAVSDGWFASKARVIVPSDVRQDKFRDVIKALRDDDLGKLPVPPEAGIKASRLRNATPVAVPGGYVFAEGDLSSRDNPRWIKATDGQRFVLPWSQVRGILRERVPDAFIGGAAP